MADHSPHAVIEGKIGEVSNRIGRAIAANGNSMRAVLGAIVLSAWLLYMGFQKLVQMWTFVLPIPVIAVAIRWHGKNRDKWQRLLRLQKHYERGLARLDGNWQGDGFTGEEFRTAHHVYEVDLQIFGEGSLFELMSTPRTGIGRRRLAAYLLEPTGIEEAKARQEAVRELSPQLDLRERIDLLGKFSFQESTWSVFADWIAVPAQTAPGYIRVAAFAASVSLCLIVLVGFSMSAQWQLVVQWVMPLIGLLLVISGLHRRRTDALNDAASRVGVEISVVREGIELLAGAKFRAPRLTEIQHRLNDAKAATILRRLERLTNGLAECEKPQFDLFAQALIVRTQLCFAIEQWKLMHGSQLEGWLAAWGEFEALAAISGYAWEHPDDVFPEFVGGSPCFVAKDLGHPLIPVAKCVRNDVALDAGNRFYIVSGSNMAGKSTLLRSIGVNAVLANAGAPVRASSLRLTSFRLVASLSIVDSILEGKSKFLAEVERVRKMLDSAREGPVLFLIDEILSGTNSRDRRVASEAVIRALVGHGAIGALSTHDLALTEIAGMDGLAGTNVHMGARPGGDPMDFDYLMKPGITTETNALAIAAMMGVISS